MEIKPTVTIDPATGAEIISYDNATVIDHSYIDEVQRQHRELEQYSYYEDENGIHSRYADALDTAEANAEQQWQQRQEYQEEDQDSEDDESGFSSGDEVAQYVLETQGDAYRTMIEWASENVDDEFIERYDAIMDEGNPIQMVEAINTLTDFYHKHR